VAQLNIFKRRSCFCPIIEYSSTSQFFMSADHAWQTKFYMQFINYRISNRPKISNMQIHIDEEFMWKVCKICFDRHSHHFDLPTSWNTMTRTNVKHRYLAKKHEAKIRWRDNLFFLWSIQKTEKKSIFPWK